MAALSERGLPVHSEGKGQEGVILKKDKLLRGAARLRGRIASLKGGKADRGEVRQNVVRSQGK